MVSRACQISSAHPASSSAGAFYWSSTIYPTDPEQAQVVAFGANVTWIGDVGCGWCGTPMHTRRVRRPISPAATGVAGVDSNDADAVLCRGGEVSDACPYGAEYDGRPAGVDPSRV